MHKKIISGFCAAALCLTAFAIPADVSAAEDAAVAIGSAKGAPGDTVSVDISLTGNPGMTSIRLTVDYDSEIFELTGISDKKLWGDSPMFDANKDGKPADLGWTDGLSDFSETGIMATLDFKIKETAEAGDYTLSLATEDENNVNMALDTVKVALTNGKISVISDSGDKPDTEVTYTRVAAKAATCTATGNVEYYTGSDNKLYTLANGVYTETTLAAVTTAKIAHNYVDGTCTVCGGKDPGYNPVAPSVTYYSVIMTGDYAGSGVTVYGARTAGSVMTVDVPVGYAADVMSGSNRIASISDGKGTFVMPAGNVKINVTNYLGAYVVGYSNSAMGCKNAYIYSYDKDMNHIKTNSVRGGMTSSEGVVTAKLGSDYAGKSVTLYSGRKSTENKVDEAVLDANGNASFTVQSGKNYTLVVEG